MKYERVFCFGDSITLAANDSRGLGWPGRLADGLPRADRAVAVYNLGVNGDTSLNIATRWRAEAQARSRNARGLLLFAFGFNDASNPDNSGLQVELPRSLDCAANLLREAQAFRENRDRFI